MITLIKEIAIRPMGSDGAYDTVKLTNIMEGVDGAATFGYSLETVAVQVEDNQTQQYKHIHTFDVRVIEESSDSAIIDGWIATQTRVEIVGRGVDGFFLMNNVLLTRNKQYDGILASAFLATRETLTSYVTGEPVIIGNNLFEVNQFGYMLPVYAGGDLFKRFNNTEGYAYNSNVWQNGLRPRDDYYSNVTNGVFEIINDDNGADGIFSYAAYAPYSDQIYKASINIVDVDLKAGNDMRFGVAFYGKLSNTNANITYVVYEDISNSDSGEITVYASDDDDLSSYSNFVPRGVSTYMLMGSVKTSYIQYDSIKLEVFPSSTKPASLASTSVTNVTDNSNI